MIAVIVHHFIHHFIITMVTIRMLIGVVSASELCGAADNDGTAVWYLCRSVSSHAGVVLYDTLDGRPQPGGLVLVLVLMLS